MAHKFSPHDFNGDGISDVLWRNSATGEVAAWLIKDATLTSVSVKFVPKDWHIVTTGDINGDKHTDIIWQNEFSGWVTTFLMRDGKIASEQSIATPTGREWRPVETGYFDLNGNHDILLQNQNNLNLDIWNMNAQVLLQTGKTNVDPLGGYFVKQAGDYDGDGTADILFVHVTSGQPVVWLMDNRIRSSSSGFDLPALGTGWTVGEAGDFNADGKSDIVWQNNDGRVDIWFMDGTKINRAATVTINAGPDMKIASTGNYNNDHYTDLLFRNLQTNQLAIWYMQDSVITQSFLIGGANQPEWLFMV